MLELNDVIIKMIAAEKGKTVGNLSKTKEFGASRLHCGIILGKKACLELPAACC